MITNLVNKDTKMSPGDNTAKLPTNPIPPNKHDPSEISLNEEFLRAAEEIGLADIAQRALRFAEEEAEKSKVETPVLRRRPSK